MKKNYAFTLPTKSNKLLLFLVLIIFNGLTIKVSGQTTGDYRSNAANGDWNKLSTWQRWNGSEWLIPTSAQGWPGQFVGTGEVTIQANQAVTISNITTQLMGKIIINGELDVIGKTNNLLQTQAVIVINKPPTPNANINFPTSQGYLRLPAGAVIDATPIDPHTQAEWLRGSCTNNNEIIIGTIAFAVCTGKGNDSPLYSFDEVQANGGTLKLLAKILPNPAITCPGVSMQLDGNPSSNAPTLSHSWTGSGSVYITSAKTIQKPLFLCNVPGTYSVTYTVTDGVSTATNTSSITVSNQFTKWTGAVNSNWNNASNWTCGIPTATTDVVIPEATTFPHANNSAAVCRNLIIYINAGLVIDAGQALTVGGDLENYGSFTIESSNLSSSGSLIVNGKSTGNVTYNRYLPTNQWFIISPPVDVSAGFERNGIRMYNPTYASNDFACYIEPNNDGWKYYNFLPSSLTPGLGYLSKLQTGNTLQFSGTLNNGDASGNVEVPVTSTGADNGWNAVGNPFTSSLKITATATGFLDVNANVLEPNYAAIYIWSDPDGDYKIITKSAYLNYSGVGSYSDAVVQAGQGFLINVKAPQPGETGYPDNTVTRSICFKKGTSGMQLHNNETSLKKTSTSWPGLTLSATINHETRSTIVAFNEEMTTGLDISYDAGLLSSSGFNIYTHLVAGNSETNFAVQCLPDNLYETLSIPVGIDVQQPGQVTFKTSGVILPTGLHPILEDRFLNTYTLLKSDRDCLTIDVTEGINGTGRFYLHFGGEPKVLLNTHKPIESNRFTAFHSNNKIIVFGVPDKDTKAWIYDMRGRILVGEYPLNQVNRNEIPFEKFSDGVYLVKIEGKAIKQTLKISVLNQ